jgi:hypothetical protein
MLLFLSSASNGWLIAIYGGAVVGAKVVGWRGIGEIAHVFVEVCRIEKLEAAVTSGLRRLALRRGRGRGVYDGGSDDAQRKTVDTGGVRRESPLLVGCDVVYGLVERDLAGVARGDVGGRGEKVVAEVVLDGLRSLGAHRLWYGRHFGGDNRR